MVTPPEGSVAVIPAEVLAEIAAAIPADCREYMTIIGSLAVGYRYFRSRPEMAVRTKNADCLISPRVAAVQKGTDIVERLFAGGWKYHATENWPEPGRKGAPLDELPVVRLHQPNAPGWFMELMTVPEDGGDRAVDLLRMQVHDNDYALPSFGFLSLTAYRPLKTDLGIHVARPEMMALANLLEHPEIKPETMSSWPSMKRSNKDLGRVIAIAWLAMDEDPDALLPWRTSWNEALAGRFPDEWHALANQVGSGLRELMANSLDFEQAYGTCVAGLLALRQPSREEYRVAADRLVVDVVEAVESGPEIR